MLAVLDLRAVGRLEMRMSGRSDGHSLIRKYCLGVDRHHTHVADTEGRSGNIHLAYRILRDSVHCHTLRSGCSLSVGS